MFWANLIGCGRFRGCFGKVKLASEDLGVVSGKSNWLQKIWGRYIPKTVKLRYSRVGDTTSQGERHQAASTIVFLDLPPAEAARLRKASGEMGLLVNLPEDMDAHRVPIALEMEHGQVMSKIEDLKRRNPQTYEGYHGMVPGRMGVLGTLHP